MFETFIKKHENYSTDKYSIDDSTKKKIYDKWKFVFDEFGYEN